MTGLFAAFDKKAERREKRRDQRNEERMKFFDGRVKDISLNTIKEYHEDFEVGLDAKLQDFAKTEDLARIAKSVNKQFKMLQNFERNRIKGELIAFLEDLELGRSKTKEAFQYIFGIYDRYKELNGNSYIEIVVAKIRDYQKRMADIE